MILGTFERMVAFRYLRARRQEGFISVIAGFSLLGIALGVATLIIVMSVMNGFRADLLGRILGLNGHLELQSASGPMVDYEDILAKLRQSAALQSVSPIVEGQVMATNQGRAGGAVVRGMRPEDLAARKLISGNIRSGSLADLDDDSILIGTRMLQKFGLHVGDRLTLVSPVGNNTAFGTAPRLKAYRIAATFEVGLYEYDSSYVYMTLTAAETFFKLGQAITGLEIFVADPDDLSAARKAVQAAVGDRPMRLYDWQQANSSLFGAVETERHVMFLILTLMIVVAAFNIISSMIMLVKDKARDIAILRTMGATRGMVLRIFILAGSSVGVIGTVFGWLLGLLFAENIEAIRQFIQSIVGYDLFSAEIYFLTRLPARVEPGDVATVVIMAFALSFLATIYPSWRAARLDPVEALRYE